MPIYSLMASSLYLKQRLQMNSKVKSFYNSQVKNYAGNSHEKIHISREAEVSFVLFMNWLSILLYFEFLNLFNNQL